jgi:hypothetical protein
VLGAKLDRRTQISLDVVVAVWCVLWLLLGYVVNREVLGLRKLSDTVVVAGQALDRTSKQLESFSTLPFVGAEVSRTAKEVHRASVSARFSGRESRKSVTSVAHWLWFSVSAIAILPILLVYGLIRVPTRRGP